MKKLFLSVFVVMIMTINTVAQNPTKVERDGNTFKSTKQTKQKSEPIVTPYSYEDNGVKYTIYMGSTGSCFILKISKNGNEYRKYLGKEISMTICSEMNIAYKGK